MTVQDAAKALHDSKYSVGGEELSLEDYLRYRLDFIATTCGEDARNLAAAYSDFDSQTPNELPANVVFEIVYKKALKELSTGAIAALEARKNLKEVNAGSPEFSAYATILEDAGNESKQQKIQATEFAEHIPQRIYGLQKAELGLGDDLPYWRQMALFIQEASVQNSQHDEKETGLTRNDRKLEEAISAMLTEMSPEMALPKRYLSFGQKHVREREEKTKIDTKAASEIASDILTSKVMVHGEEEPAVLFLKTVLAKVAENNDSKRIQIIQYLEGKGPKPKDFDVERLRDPAKQLGFKGDFLRKDNQAVLKEIEVAYRKLAQDTVRLIGEIGHVLESIAQGSPDSEISPETKDKILQAMASMASIDFTGVNQTKIEFRKKFMALNDALNPALGQKK